MTETPDKSTVTGSSSSGRVEPIHVCIVIGSLEFGGAERQVVEMARSFDKSRVQLTICSLSSEVPLAKGLDGSGAELVIIEKRGRFDFTAVLRLAKLFKDRDFDVVHGFLFDAEIVSRLAAQLTGVPVVVASERNTDYVRPFLHKIATKATLPIVDVMVANSTSGKRFNMKTLGLADSKIEVVYNGLDANRFYPDPEAGRNFRRDHEIPLDVPLVGMVASFKRQKGHRYFLEMASKIVESSPETHFMIVGGVIRERTGRSDEYAEEVRSLFESSGLDERCRFLDIQEDVLGVYNACDATALLSLREGTPNVVLESMACEVPVVVSDAADNAIIVQDGKNGFVVPKEDSNLAAERMKQLLSDSGFRRQLGVAARERICSGFTPEQTAHKFESIYRERLAR